jgi:thiol-disulfide isomerase/thioredoxin
MIWLKCQCARKEEKINNNSGDSMNIARIILTSVMIVVCSAALQAKPQEVTSLAEFNKALKNKFVVVKFWMNGCPPCNAMKPHYEKAASDADLNAHVTFLSVKGPSEVSDEYGITGFPTLLYFKNGKKLCKGNARTTPELKKEIKSKFGL